MVLSLIEGTRQQDQGSQQWLTALVEVVSMSILKRAWSFGLLPEGLKT
jgi:hypothetical protein